MPVWLATVKGIVEIAAILLGGYWTYDKFIKTEKPALERNFKAEGTLMWQEVSDPDVCMAIVHIQLKNISKSKIQITKVKRYAWYIERPELGTAIQYFNPLAVYGSPSVDSAEYSDGPFVQDYPPEGGSAHTLIWFVKKRPNTFALFWVDFFGASSSQRDVYYYAWVEATCEAKAQTN